MFTQCYYPVPSSSLSRSKFRNTQTSETLSLFNVSLFPVHANRKQVSWIRQVQFVASINSVSNFFFFFLNGIYTSPERRRNQGRHGVCSSRRDGRGERPTTTHSTRSEPRQLTGEPSVSQSRSRPPEPHCRQITGHKSPERGKGGKTPDH